MNPFEKSVKAVRELGLPKLVYFGLYQAGLRTGHYRRMTPSVQDPFNGTPALQPVESLPQIPENHQRQALAAAEAIRQGKYPLFGADLTDLDLTAGASPRHWTELEQQPPEYDLKYTWEPGRFGWAIALARAYAISGDPVYASDFWDKTQQFLVAHPPNLGRQWQSAQEVAIRLTALVFCDRVFALAPSSTSHNRQRLWQAVAEHAQRIPPTLMYARAQNNNHLISEAAGLYTAGHYLAGHPQASKWRQVGWRWLNWAFQHQIDAFGTYVQHSVNYHRVMLQLALFTDHLRRLVGDPDWPDATQVKLAEATRWLWALTDPETGKTPNLGANDGAYIFPLTSLEQNDFRPVVDAAAKAFLKQDIYQQPECSEMAGWFDLTAPAIPISRQPQAADMLRIESGHGRAFIHTAHYTDRPSHADQLHVDLWWRGVNVAQDPGTFQYSGPAPWDNSLVSARLHNTLTLDGQDQMTRAGRFLWLDWAQAQVLAHEIDEEGQLARVTAEHDGYKKLGALVQRTLHKTDDGWQVIDQVLPYEGHSDNLPHQACITWLLPDWQWHLSSAKTLQLNGPDFAFSIEIQTVDKIFLFRSGHCVLGVKQSAIPNWGWHSPTYGKIHPALMFAATLQGKLPLTIQSTWRFDLP